MSSIQEKKIKLLAYSYCKLHCSTQQPYTVIKNLVYKYSRDTDWFINNNYNNDDDKVYKKFYNGCIAIDFKKYPYCEFYWQFKIIADSIRNKFEIGICNQILTCKKSDCIKAYFFQPFIGIKGEWISDDGGEETYQYSAFHEPYKAVKFNSNDTYNMRLSVSYTNISLSFAKKEKYRKNKCIDIKQNYFCQMCMSTHDVVDSKWRIFTTADPIKIDSFNIKTSLATYYKHNNN